MDKMGMSTTVRCGPAKQFCRAGCGLRAWRTAAWARRCRTPRTHLVEGVERAVVEPSGELGDVAVRVLMAHLVVGAGATVLEQHHTRSMLFVCASRRWWRINPRDEWVTTEEVRVCAEAVDATAHTAETQGLA